MKILHTSDWHLGQEFYSYDRSDEHRAFFDQLTGIVADEQPDALLVSGDIYHNATPPNSVVRLFTDALCRLREAAPAMQMVVVAGNHDSASRLEVARNLWRHVQVTVLGRIERTPQGEVDLARHVVPLMGREGRPAGWVVALPHLFQQNYPLMGDDTPREQRQARFMQALGEQVAALNPHGLPVVMMAHLALAGSDITGHDTAPGGFDYTAPADLAAIPYDYLALGHIHCPQTLCEGRARYCGSPLPVSFDENYPHSVSIVQLQGQGTPPRIETRPIANPRPLLTLPREAVALEQALPLLAALPPGQEAYVRLHVRLSDLPPAGAMERALQAMQGKRARFCCFKWERAATAAQAEPQTMDVEQIKRLSPIEVAQLFYRDRYGRPMEEELRRLLAGVVENLHRNDD